MKRRALIIFCDNSRSGPLPGARMDYLNLTHFLTSPLGGNWYDKEIVVLRNPKIRRVLEIKSKLFRNTNYSFVAFSGHGSYNIDQNKQFIELRDGIYSIDSLINDSPKQTLIVDACRDLYTSKGQLQGFGLGDVSEHYFTGQRSTRPIFDSFVERADYGLTALYSSSQGQSSIDTPDGGLYTTSLLQSAYNWEAYQGYSNGISVARAHQLATQNITLKYPYDGQLPSSNIDPNRQQFPFPFAVKY